VPSSDNWTGYGGPSARGPFTSGGLNAAQPTVVNAVARESVKINRFQIVDTAHIIFASVRRIILILGGAVA
jgi:hypothetical protein